MVCQLGNMMLGFVLIKEADRGLHICLAFVILAAVFLPAVKNQQINPKVHHTE